MNNNLFKLIILVVACCLGGAACSTAPSKPDWLGKNWEDRENVYFSGIASNCDTVQKTREIAYINAVNSFVEYTGIKVQVKLESTLTEEWQGIDAYYLATSNEILVKNIFVDKFEFFKEKDKFSGHILIRISKRQILAIQQELIDQESKAKQEQLRRQSLGPFYVVPVKGWNEIKPLLEDKLTSLGYQTSKKGKSVYVRVNQFNCQKNQLAQITICKLHLEMFCNGAKSFFDVKGYGKDSNQAKEDALQSWMLEISEKFIEGL